MATFRGVSTPRHLGDLADALKDISGTRGPMANSKLADLSFFLDYSVDMEFQMPNWPYYPDRAKPYDYRSITKENLMDGFSKVVGKHWGRVITGLNPNLQGAYQIEGNKLWGDLRLVVTAGDVLDERYVVPGSSDGTGAFGLLTGMTLEYHDQADTLARVNPILLAGNLTETKFGFILLPKRILKELALVQGVDLQHWFGDSYMENLTLHLGECRMPFPFSAANTEFKDYKYFNKTQVGVKLVVNPEYVVSHVMIGRVNGQVTVDVPGNSKGEYPLLFGHDGVAFSMSPYAYLASILLRGHQAGMISFASLMGDGVDAHAVETVKSNRSLMLKSFSGSPVEKGEKFQNVQVDNIPVPDGLEELPEAPLGYIYISDLSGIVYLADRNLKGILFPYQVFDLHQMRNVLDGLYEKAEKEKQKSHDGEITETLEIAIEKQEEQIRLVEALFAHQEAVMKGNQFNYGMMRGQHE